jgi:hypothetical protein
MSRRAGARIAENVREEFELLRGDLERYLRPDSEVDHARHLLAGHVPTMVVGRAHLLLDTLLGYLMEDAIQALRDAPVKTKNGFFALELRSSIKESFKLEADTLVFSTDPRIVFGAAAAGGTAATSAAVMALLLTSLVSRVAGGVATLVASALAFRTGYAAASGLAHRRLADDVYEYVEQSEKHVSAWLTTVENAFFEAFEEFQRNHPGTAQVDR